ncbi:MAG: isocitrate lyase/phosphoenolpyruvate mutase family protein [Gemmatimonadetes bacterium]|nr:isocitrate lyase/phosphoenolpyruvate mutase family protein [Gemmatimonadota bacterium]
MSPSARLDRIRRDFRDLHRAGCFLIPNPWDVGSARYLAARGVKALATTSSGFAWTLGKADTQVTVDQALAHFAAVAEAVEIGVNGDFEGAYAVDPDAVARKVTRAVATGVAGLSVEDSTGRADDPLFGFDLAVARVKAAREAIDRSGTGVLLTGRSEGFIAGRPDLTETIRRLQAYRAAGAECLYAPGIRTAEEIAAVVRAVAPAPVNVLVGGNFTTVAALGALGVRRISVGGALARAAWHGFMGAVDEILTEGTFNRLTEARPFSEIDGLFH